MAIGWLTALKLVPWGDVIEATPQALKAAKALLKKREEAPVPPTDASGHVLLTPEMLNQWRQEQKTTLEAIEKLATAQASLIAEIERVERYPPSPNPLPRLDNSRRCVACCEWVPKPCPAGLVPAEDDSRGASSGRQALRSRLQEPRPCGKTETGADRSKRSPNPFCKTCSPPGHPAKAGNLSRRAKFRTHT